MRTESRHNRPRHAALLATIFLFYIASPLHYSSQLELPSEFAKLKSDDVESDSPIQTLVADFGIFNQSDISGVIDEQNRVHIVWVPVNENSLNYAMFSNSGESLIGNTSLFEGITGEVSSPEAVIDSLRRIHIVWKQANEIRYTLIDPYSDDLDGSSANVSLITLRESTVIAEGEGSRSNPDIAIDSNDAAHIVWVDSKDPLGLLYDSNNVYYTMLELEPTLGFRTVIGQTMVTQTISQSNNPAISVGDDDMVAIAWEDSRGSNIEFVGVLDTSGSMNTEWADMCVVFYGGYFASGGYFPGLKPMLQQHNITVMETLYALSGNWPSAATSGNCATAYQTGGSGSQGPRTTSLSAGDDSGGIRELTEVVYNNGAVNLPQDGGYYSEFWGPGSTWACLSWNDTSGNSPGNPPTTLDHRWNFTASKFVIPVSDEGPYGGDPSQQSDDTQSINEAHDACVQAGIIPVPLLASGFGSGSTNVGSHMMDLAQCPNGFVNLNPRTCPGSTIRETDAGGQMYNFPTTASNSAELEIMVSALIELSTSGTSEIFMTLMDPYSFIDNPRPSWSIGDSGSITETSPTDWYGEYSGPSIDSLGYGNLVVSNDTRITHSTEWSTNPDIDIDEYGNVHLSWTDGRFNVMDRDGPSQIHYMQIDPNRDGNLDGEAINLNDTVTVVDSAIESSNLTWGVNSRIVVDSDDSVNLVWFETENFRTDIRWMRLQLPQYGLGNQLEIDLELDEAYSIIETETIASGTSGLLGVDGDDVNSVRQPIVSFMWPYRSLLWTSADCSSSNIDFDVETELCLWSETDYLIRIQLDSQNSSNITLTPEGTAHIGMTLFGESIPGGSDTVNINTSETPDYWLATTGAGFSYMTSFTLTDGGSVQMGLFLRAPNLRQVNENQSFDVRITAYSNTYELSTASISLHVDLINLGDWDDDDGDGVHDDDDYCQWGESGWTSNSSNDYDGDGCKDSTEDPDDDDDDVLDVYDLCPTGYMGNDTIDRDGDGCDDRYEDDDIDGDGIPNHLDLCPDGVLNMDPSEDHDGDGCHDIDEDDNDDGDPYLDVDDDCPSGATWWDDPSFDFDNDGCHNLLEDDDDDNDGVQDNLDDCPEGSIDWSSSPSLDWDGDGCKDFVEDEDIDNDGVYNDFDECLYGEVGWTSSPFTDWDGDGCKDSSEDDDDDNDGHLDSDDDCQRSPEVSAASVDADRDGCDDRLEDDDLDNDGVVSDLDACEGSPLSAWTSNLFNDRDGDGCADETEDDDDDNDGVEDEIDPCPDSPLPGIEPDYDSDGCMDYSEDDDDDNDGVIDEIDLCPTGELGWVSNSRNDRDGDGCNDKLEDESVPTNILEVIQESTPLKILIAAAFAMLALLAISKSGQSSSSLLSKRKGKRRPKPPEPWALREEKDLDEIVNEKKRRLKRKRKPKPKDTPPLADSEQDSPEPNSEKVEEIIEEIHSEPEETTIDDLWEIADGNETPTIPAELESEETPPPPPPPEPEQPATEDATPAESSDHDPDDPVSWLRLAGKMAAEGRHDEAEACRKTAMDLMQKNS